MAPTSPRLQRDALLLRGFDDLVTRLTARFHGRTVGEVSELLVCALQATSGARVHGYWRSSNSKRISE
jgi:hypothetical protein